MIKPSDATMAELPDVVRDYISDIVVQGQH